MRIPERPADEAKRLEVLHALHILDTAPENRFDRITRLAVKLFNIPTALISLVDDKRQWFKSKQGLDFAETDRDIAFSAHTILRTDIFTIADLAADEEFSDNPLVSGNQHFRFYAGAPLRLSNGYCVGSLCLFDTKPRLLSEQDRYALRDLADGAEAELARSEMAILMEQFRYSKIRYRTVLDTVLDAVLTIDSKGIIQTVNSAAQIMFGYPQEELVGENVSILMPEPHQSQHDGYLQRYHATGISHVMGMPRQLEGRHKSGLVFPIELAVSRMDMGQDIFFTGTIRI